MKSYFVTTAVLSVVLFFSANSYVPVQHVAAQAVPAVAPAIKPHLPTPPTPNCQCGCTVTGKCTCKDCDHPCLVKPVAKANPPGAKSDPPGPVTPPYLKLPATKVAKPNRYFCLRPDTNCKSVKWVVPAGLDRLDPEIPVKDTDALVLIGDAGTYTVQAYGALGDKATDLASCVVTVGVPPPTPPPGPVDTFTAAVQQAYAAETSPTKAADAAKLTNLFLAAVGHVDLPNVMTTADLLSDLKSTLTAFVPGALPQVKVVLVSELTRAFGATGSQPLDKAAAKVELKRIAAALGTLR